MSDENEIKRLRKAQREALDYIDMAENRLECVDCPKCVELAVSYLVEARALLKSRPSEG